MQEDGYDHEGGECSAEAPSDMLEIYSRTLIYALDSKTLTERFKEKARQCRAIAASHSKTASLCEHGIVLQMEQQAEQYDLRAKWLAPGLYKLQGDLLTNIFQNVVDPAATQAKLAGLDTQAIESMPRGI